jgi:Mg/Co/Ni transporter MgtE
MEKLSKCKQYAKEFGVSVLTGTAILFLLFGLATSIQYSLLLLGVAVGMGCIFYLLWRLM